MAKIFRKFKKDPADVLDYLNDWQALPLAFLGSGETIESSGWTAYTTAWGSTDDITIDSSSFTDTTSTVWLSEGVRGVTYYLTNHIVTNQSREKDETIQIIMEEQ